jgi:hypothetical protein
VVSFDDLVLNTSKTVQNIYQQLGLDLSPDFREIVENEGQRAKDHQSQHQYSLEEMGIKARELMDLYAPIIETYQLRK